VYTGPLARPRIFTCAHISPKPTCHKAGLGPPRLQCSHSHPPPIARSHVTPPHVLPRALAAATARTPRGAAALTWRCSTALARFNPALFGSALRDAVAFSCWVVPALWEEVPAQARPYSLFFAQALFPTTNPTFNQEFESKFKYDNQNLIYQVYTSHNRSSNLIYITYIDQVII